MRNLYVYAVACAPLDFVVEAVRQVGLTTRTIPTGMCTAAKARAYSIMFTDDVTLTPERVEKEVRFSFISATTAFGNPEPLWADIESTFGATKCEKIGSFAVTAADFAALWLRVSDSPLIGLGKFVAQDLNVDLASNEVRAVVTQQILQLPREMQACCCDYVLLAAGDKDLAFVQTDVQRGAAYKITPFSEQQGFLKQMWKGVTIAFAPTKTAIDDPAPVLNTTGMQQCLQGTWLPDTNSWFEGKPVELPKQVELPSLKARKYTVPQKYVTQFWYTGLPK